MKAKVALVAIFAAGALGGIWIVRSGPKQANAERENSGTSETTDYDRATKCYEMALRLDEQRVQTLSQLDPNADPIAKKSTEEVEAGPDASQTMPGLEAKQLQELDAELTNTDAYVEQERRRIEASYASQLANLESEAEKRLQELEGTEKTAYARCLQQIKETTTLTVTDKAEETYGQAGLYVDAYGNPVVSGYERTDGVEVEAAHTFVEGDPTGEYEAALDKIKRSRKVTEQDLLRAQRRLAAMREWRLFCLESEAERRRALVDWKKRRIVKMAQREGSGAPPLTVGSIGMSADNRFYALVNGSLVYEGDVVDGYGVVKIEENKVTFEKDGRAVVQAMNQ